MIQEELETFAENIIYEELVVLHTVLNWLRLDRVREFIPMTKINEFMSKVWK